MSRSSAVADRTPAARTGAQPAGDGPVANIRVGFDITGAKVTTFRSLYRLERRGLLQCPIVGVAVDDRAVERRRDRARDSIDGVTYERVGGHHTAPAAALNGSLLVDIFRKTMALVIRTLAALLRLTRAPRTRLPLAVALGCVAPLRSEGRILPAAEWFTGPPLDPTAIL